MGAAGGRVVLGGGAHDGRPGRFLPGKVQKAGCPPTPTSLIPPPNFFLRAQAPPKSLFPSHLHSGG